MSSPRRCVWCGADHQDSDENAGLVRSVLPLPGLGSLSCLWCFCCPGVLLDVALRCWCHQHSSDLSRVTSLIAPQGRWVVLACCTKICVGRQRDARGHARNMRPTGVWSGSVPPADSLFFAGWSIHGSQGGSRAHPYLGGTHRAPWVRSDVRYLRVTRAGHGYWGPIVCMLLFPSHSFHPPPPLSEWSLRAALIPLPVP